ncbi:MAG TPA: hypothetical protein VMY35_10940 [Phycisphaerae bacterium]|nr:hypothetical protein [Phycisphaerae bacterium]
MTGKPTAGETNPPLTDQAAFAGRVLQIMRDAHLTLDEFRQMLGCTKDAVWRLRSGKTQKIDLGLLIAVAKWAISRGYRIEWLLMGSGPEKATPPRAADDRSPLEIADKAAMIIAVSTMAEGLGLDLEDMALQWGRAMLSGSVPRIDGMELMARVTDFFKKKGVK